jgi:hypothetical protein
VTRVHEHRRQGWLIGWNLSLKTKANYHGLLFGVFNYALEQVSITLNPFHRTAPKRSRIRQSQADLRFLTEQEFAPPSPATPFRPHRSALSQAWSPALDLWVNPKRRSLAPYPSAG